MFPPSACESTRSFLSNKVMNENYNKHRQNIIIVLSVITVILVACSYNNGKNTYIY